MKRAFVLVAALVAGALAALRSQQGTRRAAPENAGGQDATAVGTQAQATARENGYPVDYGAGNEATSVKVLVLYYSSTGHNYELAGVAAEAAAQDGALVRLRKVPETAPQDVIDTQEAWKAHQAATAHVPEVTLADLEWADAFLLSVPTRYGAAASQMRSFIDTTGGLWYQGKLANKAASVMTSAQNPNGGVETTLQSVYISLMHWGCILVPPGYTDQSVFAAGGNPYGASLAAGGSVTEEARSVARHQARRLVLFARRLTSVRTAS